MKFEHYEIDYFKAQSLLDYVGHSGEFTDEQFITEQELQNRGLWVDNCSPAETGAVLIVENRVYCSEKLFFAQVMRLDKIDMEFRLELEKTLEDFLVELAKQGDELGEKPMDVAREVDLWFVGKPAWDHISNMSNNGYDNLIGRIMQARGAKPV